MSIFKLFNSVVIIFETFNIYLKVSFKKILIIFGNPTLRFYIKYTCSLLAYIREYCW